MRYLLLAALFGLTGCLSSKLGMTEEAWKKRTLIAHIAMEEPGVRVYRSGIYYYTFKNGVLVKQEEVGHSRRIIVRHEDEEP